MINWFRRMIPLLRPRPPRPSGSGGNVWIIPSGRATMGDPCSMCGRLADDEPFMVYGKPVCEDCFLKFGFFHAVLLRVKQGRNAHLN